MKKKDREIDDIWLPKPLKEDYAAALDYLTLLFPPAQVRKLTEALTRAPLIHRQAKDLLRASQTHLLEADNPHVTNQLKKIKKGKRISPVLLVRGDARTGVTLTIADGHHRICASWYWDEDAPIACCVVALPAGR
jgi:hypothetical protein